MAKKKVEPAKPKKPPFWRDLMGKPKTDAVALCDTNGYDLIATIEDGSMKLGLPRAKRKRLKVEIDEGLVTKVIGVG